MAKFITGKELEKAVCDIIWDAQSTLLIVSPFIKLDDYFKALFKKHANNFNVHLLLVFGKNEGNLSRSLSKNDFDFFKGFPNVSIIYVANLHAKYYGNEAKGVITSINLYDHSFKNNIEFGVYSENTLLNRISQSSDQQAWDECINIANTGEPIFIKRPVFQKKLLSVITGKNYIKSNVLYDNTDSFYSLRSQRKSTLERLLDFPEEIDHDAENSLRPEREEFNSTKVGKKQMGYCIRTGEPIPFNPGRPYSERAYQSWAEFKNYDYPEKYCHKSGKQSYKKTSMRYPILPNE